MVHYRTPFQDLLEDRATVKTSKTVETARPLPPVEREVAEPVEARR